MRVALLSRAVFPLHGYGGLERHVAALEKFLRRAGCDVTLYTSPPRSPAPDREGARFVPYRVVPWPRRKGFVVLDRDTNYLAWSLRAAKRLLADARADIVQADGGAGFGYAALRKKLSPPLVLHPHGMEEFLSPPLKRALYLPLRAAIRFAARRADRVLVPDSSMKDDVVANLGVPEQSTALVPNALDLEEIDGRTPTSLDRFTIASGDRVVLSVGRLESNKGFSYLVRALARIRLEHPDVLSLLVGEGPERTRLEREIAASGLAGRARLVGRVSDEELSSLYRRADLFVHPTLFEGSSMVTLEAMAHRKPVVATRVGGIPDKVLPGESGLLVPPADERALAAAIREALDSKERLSRWGARGRAIVEERFSWSRRIEELLELYRAILREKGATDTA